MDKAWQAGGSAARPLVHTASAPQQPQRAGSEQADLLHACSAQARLEGAPSATPSDGGSEKVRKPYTITKQRERWTDAEHALFLEALREHGRAWRRIEEHIGTKTAVQIRSHAQKFFAKLEREQASGNKSTELPPDLTIPPPRPKRKPARPYPKKSEPEASDTGAGAAAAQPGNGAGGSGELQRHGPLHGSQHLAASAASPAGRPSASPSQGTHSFGTQALLQGASSMPAMGSHLPPRKPEWAHQGLQRASMDANVAAIAAAASAAAAAAAAAVVATADEATQAQLQASPPQGFPFFGMPPSALALFAGQMQGSPQVAGLAAAQQQVAQQQAHQQQAHQQHCNQGSVRRHHARSPRVVPSARDWAGPGPAPGAPLEWTATSGDAPGQGPDALRVPSRPGSENDGDSACSRETRSREARSGPAAFGAGRLAGSLELRTGSGTNLLAGSGAAAAAAAASAAAADRTMQLARAATFGPGGLRSGALSAAGGADMRAASQWAHLPIAALLQAAAVSGGQPDAVQPPQQQLELPPVAPMAHSHLFKPPFRPASPDVSNRRAERAGKLRARRGGSEAAGMGGSGGSGGSGTHGGSSGQASFDNFSMPARQQASFSDSRGKDITRDAATAAANRSGQPSGSPAGDAGSDGSQDSLLAKNASGDGDSDKAEGYGSNPNGNGSSDGLNASNGSGDGNGSSHGGDDACKPSPLAPSGDGTSKAPGRLLPGARAPDPEQCAGKAHAHAHAQAHPHARAPTAQLAALQGLTNAAGMMPPTSAAVAAASANLSGWNPSMQALAAQQGIANPYMLQAAAAGQTLNPSGLNSAALAALVSAGVGNPSWVASAAQLQGSSSMLPMGSLLSSGHALQQQALLEQVRAQRQASLALERLACQRQAAAQYENHHIDGPRPQPGQQQHSAFEPASQKTPPPSFSKPGPAAQAMGTGGASRSPSGSPPDGAGSPGDRALLERMPSRPRANRASPMGPPLKLAAAVEAAAKGSSGGAGEVLLGPKDRDVAGGRSSNASSMSGFQPYRSGSGTLKHSMSGSRLDVPPRKRLHLCALDQVEAVR